MRRVLRHFGPIVAGFVCLVVAQSVTGLAAWLLLLAAITLIFDGATAAWARQNRAGGLPSYRQ